MAAIADARRVDVLVGARILGDGRGVDAGLGGEGRGADVGRLAVGGAVDHVVEALGDMRSAARALGRDADLEAVGIGRLQHQRRDERGEVGVAAALADAVERALDLARRRPRTAASELATACSVSLWAWMPRWSPGMTFATSRDDGLDLLAAASRHWCRRARPSARRRRRRPWRRPAHRPGWPCSRRRSARSRGAPPCRPHAPPSTDWRIAVEVLLLRGAGARRARDSPTSWRRSRWRRTCASSSARKPGSLERLTPGRLVMPKAVKVARLASASARRRRCRSGWRRDSRPRHSRCRGASSMPATWQLVLEREVDAVGLRAVAQRRVEHAQRLFAPMPGVVISETAFDGDTETRIGQRRPRANARAANVLNWDSGRVRAQSPLTVEQGADRALDGRYRTGC